MGTSQSSAKRLVFPGRSLVKNLKSNIFRAGFCGTAHTKPNSDSPLKKMNDLSNFD